MTIPIPMSLSSINFLAWRPLPFHRFLSGSVFPPTGFLSGSVFPPTGRDLQLGRIRHLDTQSLWLQQALRQRRLGLSKVLGTENPSDLMTKHVDAKLLGEHIHSMGCEFAEGRAELAPQVVQGIEDSEDNRTEDTVNTVEDDSEIASEGCESERSPSGLMTAAATSDGSTAHGNPLRNRHRIVCATRPSGSLASMKLNGRRWGTGKCAQSPRDDQPCRPSLPRDKRRISCIGPGEHLRGHPCQFLVLPQGRSRSRGGACFCSACPCRRLSICDYTRALWRDASTGEHRAHMRCIYFSFSLDALWAQA